MKVEYYVTDATTGIPVWAEIRKATQFDYKKTVEEQWQTSWLSDFIQTDSLEKYALEIAATGELVGLGAYRDMPEGVLVYVEYIPERLPAFWYMLNISKAHRIVILH